MEELDTRAVILRINRGIINEARPIHKSAFIKTAKSTRVSLRKERKVLGFIVE
jgi:hypothetical protein